MKTRTTIGLWVAAIIGGLLLMSAGPSAADDYDPANPPVVTGCVIRFTSSGPAIHENSAHSCTGAQSLQVEPDGDLFIEHAAWHGPIVSIVVEEDESIAGRRISCGPSDGLGKTTIRCWRTDTGAFVRADSSQLVCQFCNLWVLWVHAGVTPPATSAPPTTAVPPPTSEAPTSEPLPSTVPPSSSEPPGEG